MIYDVIIAGAGASGLFAGALLSPGCARGAAGSGDAVRSGQSALTGFRGLILEKTNSPGNKLLLTGKGQCNLTRTGSIKEFVSHYGANGKAIRSMLYKHSNTAMMDFFHQNGVKLFAREDGHVFPSSLSAQEILTCLVEGCRKNGFVFAFAEAVTAIATGQQAFQGLMSNETASEAAAADVCNNASLIHVTATSTATGRQTVYMTRHLILACGGSSYPRTGSDGRILDIAGRFGLGIVPPRPALAPVYVKGYPYAKLSGISIQAAVISAQEARPPAFDGSSSSPSDSAVSAAASPPAAAGGEGPPVQVCGDLLFTHECFSGPAALHISRYLLPFSRISFNYIPFCRFDETLDQLESAAPGNRKEIAAFLSLHFGERLPRRLISAILSRQKLQPHQPVCQLAQKQLKDILQALTADTYEVSHLGGYPVAMATAGGVALEEIESRTCRAKKHEGLYIIGEMLDVDGDTGGYNLQFAFSSASAAASAVKARL